MSHRVSVEAPRRQRVDAHGALTIRAGDGLRAIAGLHQRGAARIRTPATDRTALEAVLMNTAGGLTGGDRLRWDIRLEPHATAVVSTAAADKLYRSDAESAVVDVHLSLADGASLDWLPQESILFDASRLERRVTVELAADARLLMADAFVFGRRAMGEVPREIELDDHWAVRREQQLVHLERLRLAETFSGLAPRKGVLHGLGAVATLLYFSGREDTHDALMAERLVQRLAALAGRESTSAVRWGVSLPRGRLVVRLAAVDSLILRRYLIPCIESLGGERAAALPRVWRV